MKIKREEKTRRKDEKPVGIFPDFPMRFLHFHRRVTEKLKIHQERNAMRDAMWGGMASSGNVQ